MTRKVVKGTRTKPAETGSDLLEELAELAHARFPEGLVRRLEHRFHGRGLDAENAVAEGVAKMAERAGSGEIDDPRAYLAAIAFNAMRQAAKRAAFEELDDAAGAGVLVEDEVLIRETFRYVKTLVEAWENKNLRTVTLLVVDSTYLGEPLTTAELAEHLEVIVGEEVSLVTVRKWKERGLARLQDQLRSLGFLE